VLTKEYFFTFKDSVSYVNPTEVFEMQQCTTVKTADDESYKQYSFVSDALLTLQKLESGGQTFYLHAETAAEKEAWIGALGK